MKAILRTSTVMDLTLLLCFLLGLCGVSATIGNLGEIPDKLTVTCMYADDNFYGTVLMFYHWVPVYTWAGRRRIGLVHCLC